MLKTTHNAGFFSCCSVKLSETIDFINSNKKLPEIVDSSEQFRMYKNDKDKDTDITFHYFENYNNVTDVDILSPINYHWNDQFIDYGNLDYKHIVPLIKKYFSPSVKINTIVNNIEKKYNIVHDNTVAVYYRGTDKHLETQLSPYDEFYEQIIKIVNINKNIKILLQSDSAEFIDYINGKVLRINDKDLKINNKGLKFNDKDLKINDTDLKNVVIIDENKTSYTNKGIHNEQSSNTNYQDMFYFLSTIIIMSKCKYIICGSGNCSIWIMFYRENNKNVIQNLNGTWYNSAF